jgi:DNA repair protein RadC
MDYVISQESWQVRDIPVRLRPREELDRLGVENVSEDVLLSVVLRSGAHGRNVVELARQLLMDYGSLTAMAKSSVDELSSSRYKGMGRVKAQVLMAALELGRRMNEEGMPQKRVVKTPEDVAGILGDRVRTLDTEIFWVLRLDSKNNLKGEPVDVTKGLLDASLVHPREVFREAIRSATAGVVLAHNHPSGDPTPSMDDIRITKQMVEAGQIVDIKVLDHVILGSPGENGSSKYVSMREDGIVRF